MRKSTVPNTQHLPNYLGSYHRLFNSSPNLHRMRDVHLFANGNHIPDFYDAGFFAELDSTTIITQISKRIETVLSIWTSKNTVQPCCSSSLCHIHDPFHLIFGIAHLLSSTFIYSNRHHYRFCDYRLFSNYVHSRPKVHKGAMVWNENAFIGRRISLDIYD